MDGINYDKLHKLHPHIRKYIIYMCTQHKMGIRNRNVQVTNIASTMKKDENVGSKYANKLTVSIPYAGRNIEWGVKFYNDNFSFSPDFELLDEMFLNSLTIETMSFHVPSWVSWKATNVSSLYNVLIELLTLYKKYQINLLKSEKYSRLYLEYSTLMERTSLKENQIEILVDSSGVIFLIDLAIDFTSLPTHFLKKLQNTEDNLGKINALLLVTFSRLDGTNAQTQVSFSPSIDQNLFGIEIKLLPPISNNGCLIDHVQKIQKLFKDKIKYIVDSYELKTLYITYLLNVFPFQILEFDQTNHSKVCLLFATDEYYWLLYIVISNYFPKEKPKWTIKSIYNIKYEPITEILHDYPYSPRWCVEEMITRAFKYTVEKIPQFKNKYLLPEFAISWGK